MTTPTGLRLCEPDELMRRLDLVKIELTTLGIYWAELLLLNDLGSESIHSLPPSRQTERQDNQRTLSELRRQFLMATEEGSSSDQLLTCFNAASILAIEGVDATVKAAAEAATAAARAASTIDHLQAEEQQ